MPAVVRAYLKACFAQTRLLVSGAVAGVVGIAETVHPFAVPAWVWFTIAGALVVVIQFLAFRSVWQQLQKTRDLTRVSRLLGTELRDIRHKIEIVQATRPRPHYPTALNFDLPRARWDELAGLVAAQPDLYTTVERAYTAAQHVTDAVRMRARRSDASTLGVIGEDGLDEAYETAGTALDALGERRGSRWESAAQRAVRQVAEDIARDATLVTPPEDAAGKGEQL
jgi:hypothetical protein